MEEQNFKNHARTVPLYHYITYLLVMVALVGSVIKLWRNYSTGIGGLFLPALLCVLSVVALLLTWYARSFSLKAQDRAIRAEENLRYFAITGNLLDSKLTLRQIIALRFAPNNELLDLAHKAANENLSAKEIKLAIQHWKADNDRV
ncbi:MAG: DUF6526 family protein [Ferruginibacter sp.]